jgi:hypothetical protein
MEHFNQFHPEDEVSPEGISPQLLGNCHSVSVTNAVGEIKANGYIFGMVWGSCRNLWTGTCTLLPTSMLEPLEPYYRRFRKRFFADATPWARDNIGWGVIVLVVPPLAAFFRDPRAPVDWVLIKNTLVLYALAFVVYALAYLCATPRRLDADRESRERLLITTIADRDHTIREREEVNRALVENPKRSPAEQHDYETAKKALELLKDKGVTALRYIRSQGTLTFRSVGYTATPLPPGLSTQEALWVYRHCASEGILNCKRNLGNVEETFAVAPHMEKVLNELLFADDVIRA